MCFFISPYIKIVKRDRFLASIFLVAARQIPPAIQRLVDAELEAGVLKHAELGGLFGCLFGRIAFFAAFVLRKSVGCVFGRFISTWHIGWLSFLCYSIHVMSAAADKSDKTPPPKPTKSTAVLLFMIAADTTWRMFLPIIGGTLLGVWADNTVTPKPMATAVGIAAGVVIAALLVRRQMNRKI